MNESSDSMHIEVILTAQEMVEYDLQGKTAVVIDTLRAASTIVAALYNGARAVEPKADIAGARERAAELRPGEYLLGGERDSIKADGFHKGNSPREYVCEVIQGKTLILSTTNGTMAIQQAKRAGRVLIAAFVNVGVTMEEAVRLQNDLVLCCSGTQGHFSLEDFVTAGAMIAYLKELGVEIRGDDRVQAAVLLYEHCKTDLVALISCSQNGIRLVEMGLLEDIIFCAQKDMLPLLCYFDGERILA